jgi:ssDNA-binding replication factor A large subunit
MGNPKPLLFVKQKPENPEDCSNVANALIADETGTVGLCLWNGQIDSISTEDTIQIENGRTSTFRGQKQLNIGKKGMLSSIDNPNN